MKQLLSISILCSMLVACSQPKTGDKIIINVAEKGAEVESSMYGIFFEEINNAGDGGLYAELVKNRSFNELEMPEGYHAEGDLLYAIPLKNHETGVVSHRSYDWTTDPVPGWKLEAGPALANMEVSKEKPYFKSEPCNLKITIKDATKPVQLINSGYWGMNIIKGDTFHLRTIIRPSADYKGSVVAKIVSQKGEILASIEMDKLKNNQWNDVSSDLNPSGSDPKAKLVLEFNTTGTILADYVSLFPAKTFFNRKNGLRKDVAEFLSGLHPKFVRWPGGCIVEGISLNNRVEWKKTLGDPAARPGEYSTWGYRNTYGFGYHEFLQYCEDINADGMFVCNVGIGCQWRTGDACSKEEVADYLDDCLDAIEYALDDKTTEWGAKRAQAGHPKPFPLKYIEIGNENFGELYDERFDIFYAAIKEKYPQLTLISNHGITGTGNIKQTDMVDPHWYVTPGFFLQNTRIFDNIERGNYKVYVGEYAVNNDVGTGNMLAALAEAAFITGMERNSDLVTMTSYAPLLENRNNRSWPVNLIWLDTDQVLGRSSYYVQKISAEHMPSYNVKLNKTMSDAFPLPITEGSAGVGAWATKGEFKDIKITREGEIFEPNLKTAATKRGEWQIKDNILSQVSLEQATRYIFDGFSGNNYTLEFKARKIDGDEGFFVYFGVNNENRNGFVFNIGGWGNTITAVQDLSNGRPANQLGSQVSQTIEKDKWYHVKVVVQPTKAELFMEGELILSYEHTSTPLQFFSAGYQEETDEVIIKVVNADSTVYNPKFMMEGISDIEKKGKIITLSAKDGNQENSFEDPKKIYPVETEYSGFDKTFDYQFDPYSYTIMRIKANRLK
jgi:alpha-N-arabinofuranosidase